MTKASDVLIMLLPEGGWATYGDTYEDIVFLEAKPITKEEFNAGVAKYDAWQSAKEAKNATAKAAAEAKLAALGLTADDLKALGLGNN
jgi:hypothetical protein